MTADFIVTGLEPFGGISSSFPILCRKQLIPKSHSCAKQHYQCVHDRYLSISILLEYIDLCGKQVQVFVKHEFLIWYLAQQ